MVISANGHRERKNIAHKKLDEITTRTVTLHPNAPWYNDDIALEKRLRRRLERKWCTTRLESDRSRYLQKCGMVNALICRSKENYYSTLIQENAHDPKVLFKVVDRI